MIIRDKDWVRVQDILNRVLPKGVEVWAYGSRVRGDAHEGSDLDMALHSKDGTTLPPQLLKALRACFAESNIPISVEIHDLQALPESFHENIRKEGVIAFSK